MKKVLNFIFALLLVLVPTSTAVAHGGGLDARGGHNCRTGSCAGTYHCHQPRSDFCKKQLGYKVTSKNKK